MFLQYYFAKKNVCDPLRIMSYESIEICWLDLRCMFQENAM